jgi:uridine kinase
MHSCAPAVLPVTTPQIPIYDFKQSQRVGYTATPVPASRVVIIEGIYALNERLKHLLDLRVSIAGEAVTVTRNRSVC